MEVVGHDFHLRKFPEKSNEMETGLCKHPEENNSHPKDTSIKPTKVTVSQVTLCFGLGKNNYGQPQRPLISDPSSDVGRGRPGSRVRSEIATGNINCLDSLTE